MKHFAKIAAASAFALLAGTVGASADACSGRSHETGTVLGATNTSDGLTQVDYAGTSEAAEKPVDNKATESLMLKRCT